MFLLPDGTLLVQLVNFAIFFAVLSVVFLRPVSRAIRARREYINGVVHDYDTYQAQANALRADADAQRAAARRDAEATIAKARAQASNESAEIGSRSTAEVAAEIERAQQTVAAEAHAARAGEDALVRQLADLMLERTIAGDAR